MSVALSAKAPVTFEIKSAELPLVALWLKSTDVLQLTQELHQRYGGASAFFDNDPLLIDLSPISENPKPLDFVALLTALRSFGLWPMAVRGGNETHTAQAQAAGLVLANDTLIERPAQTPTPVTAALVIDKPLRSGQQVYARGRDLIVMAMVNPGAEVIADGHIHVYAPLRGKAMAGARGNTEARIMTLSMEAQLLSIAGVYRTSENDLPAAVHGKAAQVRLQSASNGQDKLIIEPLNP